LNYLDYDGKRLKFKVEKRVFTLLAFDANFALTDICDSGSKGKSKTKSIPLCFVACISLENFFNIALSFFVNSVARILYADLEPLAKSLHPDDNFSALKGNESHKKGHGLQLQVRK